MLCGRWFGHQEPGIIHTTSRRPRLLRLAPGGNGQPREVPDCQGAGGSPAQRTTRWLCAGGADGAAAAWTPCTHVHLPPEALRVASRCLPWAQVRWHGCMTCETMALPQFRPWLRPQAHSSSYPQSCTYLRVPLLYTLPLLCIDVQAPVSHRHPVSAYVCTAYRLHEWFKWACECAQVAILRGMGTRRFRLRRRQLLPVGSHRYRQPTAAAASR
jgi:hypothetical protein